MSRLLERSGTRLGLVLLDELRRVGLSSHCDYRATTLKAHLRQADRSQCRYAILLGDDEAVRGSVILRNLESKAQEELPLTGLSSLLKARISSLIIHSFFDIDFVLKSS